MIARSCCDDMVRVNHLLTYIKRIASAGYVGASVSNRFLL
jgi:hypothetical protein